MKPPSLWTVAPDQPMLCQALARDLHISPLLAQCLVNRNLQDPELIQRFLEPRLQYLADPFQLPDMPAAVQRLRQAREHDETVVIFGDYDVDGITATTILSESLTHLGWRAHPFLPDRFEDGYGLSAGAVRHCLEQRPAQLVLAVDCGSNAVDTISDLRRDGIDTVVLDHHQLSGPAPPAAALVNPWRQPGSDRAGLELCSAGLAFKLAHALVKEGRSRGETSAAEFDVRSLLDLVALGTVADLVPLTGENRIFVKAGLDRLNRTHRPGLQALRDAAAIQDTIGGYEVGFQLAPRLNAAGRMESAMAALDLLMAKDRASADPLARRLDAHNRERQETERRTVAEMTEAIRQSFDPQQHWVLVEGRSHWHLGVVGIVASRLVQEFYRPALVLGGDGDAWRGSGRSIEGFDLAQALEACHDLLLRHGGHAMAAGFSVAPEKLDALRARLNELARQAPPEIWQPRLRLDQVVDLDEVHDESLRELNRLQHTGIGNPPVHLCARNVGHHRPLLRMGAQKQHVKMWVTNGRVTHQAVWWGAGHRDLPVGRFDLAFIPRFNRFNGQTSVQLQVLDWKSHSP